LEQWVQAVIAGFTKMKETDSTFSGLIIAIPDGKEFRYIGAVGSGCKECARHKRENVSRESDKVNLFQDNRINIRSGILCKRLLLVAVGSH
jgi:ATP-dependent DNA ligase